jgi:hypothetical protein
MAKAVKTANVTGVGRKLVRDVETKVSSEDESWFKIFERGVRRCSVG